MATSVPCVRNLSIPDKASPSCPLQADKILLSGGYATGTKPSPVMNTARLAERLELYLDGTGRTGCQTGRQHNLHRYKNLGTAAEKLKNYAPNMTPPAWSDTL